MKLPTKRSYESRSMSTAMRDPVLMDKNFVQNRAAIQKFIPKENPKDYERLANAQMRAAQAEGNVGLALAEAGIKFGDAALQVNTIHQTTAADTRHADLKAWVGQYSADLSGVQLSAWNEERGGYNYEFVEGDFEKAWKKKNEELDKQYKINNGLIRQDLGNKTKGIKTAMGMELAKFVRGAEDEASQFSSMKQYGLIKNEDDIQDWKVTAQLIFPPEKVYQMENEARSVVTYNAFKGRIESVEGKSNDQLDLMQEELDALLLPTPGGAPKIQAKEFGYAQKLIDRQRLINQSETFGAIETAQTEADIRLAYDEGMYRLGSSDLMAGERVKLEGLFTSRLSKIKVKDAATSMRDETGQLLGDAGTYSALAESVYNDMEISPADKEAFEAMLIGAVVEMHINEMSNAFLANPGVDATQGAADLYKQAVLLKPAEELGLRADNTRGKAEVYSQLNAHLDYLKEARLDVTGKIDAEARKRMQASNFWNGTGTIDKSERVELAQYSWEAYLTRNFDAGLPPEKAGEAQQALFRQFLRDYGAAPQGVVDTFVEQARIGSPAEKANAYRTLARINEMTGGRLEWQSGVDSETMKHAIAIDQKLEGVSAENQGDVIENYIAMSEDLSVDNSRADNLWKSVSTFDSEELQNSLEVYFKDQGLPDEMDEVTKGAFMAYFKDAVYRYEHTGAAVRSAMGAIRNRIGIENGVMKFNSIYAMHEAANSRQDDEWHNGRNPVRATVEELSRRSNVDVEDIYFLWSEEHEAFAAFNKGTGNYITVEEPMVDENGNAVLDRFGKPVMEEVDVIFSKSTLSAEGEQQRDVTTAIEAQNIATENDEKFTNSLVDERFQPNQFGQYTYGSNSAAVDRGEKTDEQLKHEDALRSRMGSDDPYEAGEADIELQVINSVQYIEASEERKEEIMTTAKAVRKSRIDAEIQARQELAPELTPNQWGQFSYGTNSQAVDEAEGVTDPVAEYEETSDNRSKDYKRFKNRNKKLKEKNN